MDTYFNKFNVPDGFEPPPQSAVDEVENNLESLFIFALVWSVGATTDDKGRKMFSNFLRMEMDNNGATNPFPEEGDVYGYSIDLQSGKWVAWLDTVEQHEIDGSLSFAEMVIPTNDSIRNIFLLEHLLTNRYHVMCTGPTGTGKLLILSSI